MENLETYGKTILIGWFLLVFVLERIISNDYFKKNNPNNDILRIFKNLLFGVLVKIMLPLFTIYVLKFLQGIYLWKLPENTIMYIIDILTLDLVLYGFHYFAHKNPLVWKFHEIHHLDKIIDSTTGLRIHFAESMIALLFKLPIIYLLAIPTKIYILYEIILTIISIFHHSNINIPSKIELLCSRIITMPNMHAVHHHATPKDTNSNYGFIFSIWDFLFNTFNCSQRQSDWEFGLKYANEKTLIKLLYYPFTKKHLRYL